MKTWVLFLGSICSKTCLGVLKLELIESLTDAFVDRITDASIH